MNELLEAKLTISRIKVQLLDRVNLYSSIGDTNILSPLYLCYYKEINNSLEY